MPENPPVRRNGARGPLGLDLLLGPPPSALLAALGVLLGPGDLLLGFHQVPEAGVAAGGLLGGRLVLGLVVPLRAGQVVGLQAEILGGGDELVLDLEHAGGAA